jgi:type I restriction enzyme R subunit
MATGSGKTFMAANAVYRLVRHARAKKVLFLVDRFNLGTQTHTEFGQFTTPDDGRKFTELYNVQHLSSQTVDPVARVVISTIQRVYSVLRGDEELDPEIDEKSLYELEEREPVEVEYNPKLPPETFDVIIIDECHRSIYGVWRQVLDYFDSFLIGLTATPSKQTFGFFNKNLVMEYDHPQAVADGVNVDFDVYRIHTHITEHGSEIDAGLVTGFRDRETRRLRWEKLDEPLEYEATALDRKVVALDQIRTVVRTFRERLFTEIFPGRTEVPKTLIFAKDDSHADDIVQVVREEFGKGNEFAVKITYRTTGAKPETLLASFRNSYNPRIVVTVDMIATGTDVRPLECVFFMRGVKSRTFFEQMKGRGVRIIGPDDLKGVTPDADAKTHFVIVDAVGVTETPLSDTQPLERKKTVGFDKLLNQVSYGSRDPEVISSIAGRLARLNRQITREDRAELEEAAGVELRELVAGLVNALDPDEQYVTAQADTGKTDPTAEEVAATATRMLSEAVKPIATNPDFRQKLIDVRRSYEQAIDTTSIDTVLHAGHSKDATERAHKLITSFREFIEEHHDEITALQVLYNVPYTERPSFADIKELAIAIERPPRQWTPERLWQAYQVLEKDRVHGSGGRMLTDLVSLIRFTLEQDDELVPYQEAVEERYAGWLLTQQQAGREFTPEQHKWLGMMKDHIAASLTIGTNDFDYVPFSEQGGLGKAFDLFGDELAAVMDDLNKVLVA